MTAGEKYWDWIGRKYKYYRDTAIAVIGITLLIVGCFLSSCKTCVPVVEIHDSIRTVEVRTRDTTIITKADSASLYALLRCDSANNVLLDALSITQGERINANTHTQVRPDGGLLIQFDCKEDSLAYVVHLQDSIIKELSKNTIVQTKEVVPPFYKNCTAAFWVLLSVVFAAGLICITIKSMKV